MELKEAFEIIIAAARHDHFTRVKEEEYKKADEIQSAINEVSLFLSNVYHRCVENR